MKKARMFLLALAMLLGLLGCGNTSAAEQIVGKTFLYEKGGFGGDFYITFQEDQTFQYYEGGLSSHIGSGTWQLDGTLLTMVDSGDPGFRNQFRVENQGLIFQEEDSDNFLYVKVRDGETFYLEEPAQP